MTSPPTVPARRNVHALDDARYGSGHDIDMDAVRGWRLGRLREQLQTHDLGGCVLGDPLNIRYATDSTNMQLWTTHNAARYAFVPMAGPVVVFDFHGSEHLSDGLNTVNEVRPGTGVYYYDGGPRLQEYAERWALEMDDLLRTSAGGHRRLGVDRCHPYAAYALARRGIEVIDIQGPIEHARAVKSAGEIACMRKAIAACQAGMRRMHEEARPGMTENEVWALLHQTNVAMGGEWIETRLLASGERTNPWMQECGFRVIRAGDMVSYDTDLIGPFGYCADLSRSFVVGARPTAAQKKLHAIALEQITHNIARLAPGLGFREFSAAGDTLPAGFRRGRYGVIAHGVGLCDEYPRIPYPADFERNGYDGVMVPGMTLCIESYVGADSGGEGVKLEQQVLITPTGAEVLSDYPFDAALTGREF